MSPRDKAEYLEYALIFVACWGVLATSVAALAVTACRAMWLRQEELTRAEQRLQSRLRVWESKAG